MLPHRLRPAAAAASYYTTLAKIMHAKEELGNIFLLCMRRIIVFFSTCPHHAVESKDTTTVGKALMNRKKLWSKQNKIKRERKFGNV